MILPLQKLINLHPGPACDSERSDAEEEQYEAKTPRGDQAGKKKPRGPFFKSFFPKVMQLNRSQNIPSKPSGSSRDKHFLPNGFRSPHPVAMADSTDTNFLPVQTLQRYHGGPNEERIKFMEENSTLATKNLGVTVEQVSIFLTSDNTVISFFESSAEDIETPMIPRLSTPETILRRSSDASMLVQVRPSSLDERDIGVTQKSGNNRRYY